MTTNFRNFFAKISLSVPIFQTIVAVYYEKISKNCQLYRVGSQAAIYDYIGKSIIVSLFKQSVYLLVQFWGPMFWFRILMHVFFSRKKS